MQSLGGTQDIPAVCADAGVPLRVGKLDASFDFTQAAADARVNHLPGPFNEVTVWCAAPLAPSPVPGACPRRAM